MHDWSKLIENLWGTSLCYIQNVRCTYIHIHSSHRYPMNWAGAICMMSSLLQLMEDGWLVMSFLLYLLLVSSRYPDTHYYMQDHRKTCQELKNTTPYHFWLCCYMYASRKIEESGNWDETFLTSHMRLSVYQASNKSSHWAMPSLWSWCSCSPLTSFFIQFHMWLNY